MPRENTGQFQANDPVRPPRTATIHPSRGTYSSESHRVARTVNVDEPVRIFRRDRAMASTKAECALFTVFAQMLQGPTCSEGRSNLRFPNPAARPRASRALVPG